MNVWGVADSSASAGQVASRSLLQARASARQPLGTQRGQPAIGVDRVDRLLDGTYGLEGELEQVGVVGVHRCLPGERR